MDTAYILRIFPNNETCINHLESVIWNGAAICPHCKRRNTYPLIKELRHHCKHCRKSFSVTLGTIFHDTRIPLQKWFLAILSVCGPQELSSRELSKALDVNKNTGLLMINRIKSAKGKSLDVVDTIINGKSVAKTVEGQTGWKRGHCKAICQDMNVLMNIKEYDYDLSNPIFIEYCRSRGVSTRFEAGSIGFSFMKNYTMTKDEYMSNEDLRPTKHHDGVKHALIDKEMESNWNGVVVGRGALQDCWEIFLQQN